MRAAGRVVADALAVLTDAVRPGTTTAQLAELAEQTIRDAGASPSFLGYHGFPAAICTSVNEQVVHGIPSSGMVLADGDLLSVDCGAVLHGWHGDAAVTLEVGAVPAADQALSAATKHAMCSGIEAAIPDARLTDISHGVQLAARRAGEASGVDYGVVAEYGGHGIGREMHMDPFVPNVGKPGKGPRLRAGMVLAIEPMLTAGGAATVELEDGWTVITADRSSSAHWEHTVAVTDDGPWVLTSADGALANDI